MRLRSKKVPAGVWVNCKNCESIIYKKDLENNFGVCPKCGYYFPLSAFERIEMLLEEDSFKEYDKNLTSTDPLKFSDTEKYSSRLKKYKKETSLKEAVVSGEGLIGQHKVVLAVLDFRFLGGSMGSAVGEKITRAIEKSLQKKHPLIIISASGGARMQEGILSLMQMAKTSGALAKLEQAKIPYISVITHPTTGGVSASFAMLGDIIIAEPRALIGFAGPRVIQQTIKQELPSGFQTAEFLLQHGMLDLVVERKNLKQTIINILDIINHKNVKQ